MSKKKKKGKDLEYQDKDIFYVTGKPEAKKDDKEEADPPDTNGGDINDKEDKNE